MKLSISAIFLGLALALQSEAIAHQGHDVPGTIQAQNGGVVKASENIYFELVRDGNTLKLYPMTHDLKPIPLKDIRIEATAQLPRVKTKSSVRFSEHPDADAAKAHFMGSFDAKSAHRYSLTITAQYLGKKDIVTFQIEPKSL